MTPTDISSISLHQLRPRIYTRWYHSLQWLLVVILCAACGTPGPTFPLSPINNQTPTNTNNFFTDDFSQPNVAWARFDTPESAAYIRDGEFYLEDRGAGIAAYAPLANKTYNLITLKVQTRHVQGTMNNWMGMICRQQDEQNYYLSAISADGYFLILKVEEGEAVPLVGPQASEIIHKGKASNTIEIHCHGDILSLTINDTPIVTLTDDTLPAEGQIALFADAVEQGEMAIVAFDHFAVLSP
ncbi:MAG: hypothetical protein JXA33_28055 [Anaerolineae bacterium]|nr:hypothetical protein [Anaerolineae bacterium]